MPLAGTSALLRIRGTSLGIKLVGVVAAVVIVGLLLTVVVLCKKTAKDSTAAVVAGQSASGSQTQYPVGAGPTGDAQYPVAVSPPEIIQYPVPLYRYTSE